MRIPLGAEGLTADDDRVRSKALSERIRQRTDIKIRDFVNGLANRYDYTTRADMMISEAAWQHVLGSSIQPHQVFAHPDMLRTHPEVSLYYRGLALLSLKRVSRVADVKGWETRSRIRPVPPDRALSVCRLYNSVISSIIEGTSHWTLDNGYRNILSNLGITLDGMFRNMIGRDAEEFIKAKIIDWLEERSLIVRRTNAREFEMSKGILMICGSEPDIMFTSGDRQLATIEIKGGKDPAGALERLGAMQKSFTETPVQCQNFLVAGVVTQEMQARLDQIAVKVYVLDNLLNDDAWNEFTTELFHYTLRIV